MQLVPLAWGGADADAVAVLNEEAFPPEERIPARYLYGGMKGLKTELLGIYAEGRFAGFISVRVHGNSAYICYFAVRAADRGRGIGGKALRLLPARYPGRQIVVDFEAPDPAAENNALRLRRRRFYLRNGFYPTGYYLYYMDTEFEIACSAPDYDRAGFERLIERIHAEAPDFNPRHYRKATS